MQLVLNYEDINRIVQLYVCKELGMSPVTDIEITMPSEEYNQTLKVELSVSHEDEWPEQC